MKRKGTLKKVFLLLACVMLVACGATNQLGKIKKIKPVEAGIESGEDFDNVKKLKAGEYQVEGTDVTISVEKQVTIEGKSVVVGEITDGKRVEVLITPTLVTNDQGTFLYGETGFSYLNRVKIFPDYISDVEEDVIWKDFPSLEVTKCSEYLNNYSMGTLGETQTEDGYHYGIYLDGEEKAGIDVKSQLYFQYSDGIAVDDNGDVYMLYYSSQPYTMEIHKVDMPEKADFDGQWWIETFPAGFGFASVSCGEKRYIIKTAEKEAMLKNGLRNLKRYPEPLSVEPTYTVVEASLENFDSYQTYFGNDFLSFHIECKMEYDDEYSYYEDYCLMEEVEKHWLGLVIPHEELEDVWFKSYTSLKEIYADVEKLNVFLDEWEEDHPDEIGAYFRDHPEMVELFPEIAEKYLPEEQ